MKDLYINNLKLRKLRETDYNDMFEWTSDKEVAKYVTWDEHSNIKETKDFLEYLLQKYKEDNTYIYGIELIDENKLIGMVDVVGFKNGNPEIGYVLNRKYWGKGYMTDALKTMVNYLLDEGYKKILISANLDNIGSNKVIKKAGFEFTGKGELERDNKKINVTVNHYEINKK